MNQNQYQQFLDLQTKLYRFSLSLTRNVSDAEDVYQETLAKIWESKEEWDQWINFEAYAMKMVRNIFLNLTKRSGSKLFVGPDEIAEVQQKNDIEQQMIVNDLKTKFQQLTSRLPDTQRNILYLREIEEYEYKEIAAILSLTEAQVKISLYRGRQHIKNKLKGYDRKSD